MDPTLDDLLLEWEERREQGTPVTPSELCGDRPDLLHELERRIDLLTRCDDLLAGEATQDEVRSDEPPVPAAVGRYSIRGVLGRGGSGDVYAGWDATLSRVVAVKVLRAADREAVGRLAREGRLMARLHHPDIVPVYEADWENDPPYLVMEHVAGGTLAKARAEMRAAGANRVVPFLARTARAVHFAHEQGVLHRDLKPSNILIGPDGGPRVTDFGIAKLWDAAELPPPTLLPGEEALLSTVVGHQPGTPAYMAPEQYDPAFGPIDRTTDVWALGVILFELLAGRRPFIGETREQLAKAVCEGPIPTVRSVNPAVHRDLDRIVSACLQRKASQRIATAARLADELNRHERTRRTRWVRGGLLLTAAAAAVGIPTALHYIDPDRRYRRSAAEVLERLNAGEEVTLIQPGGTPPLIVVRAGAGATQTEQTADGFVVRSAVLAVVELLPELLAGPLTVTVELRHDRNEFERRSLNMVGLTTGTAHLTRGPLGYHLLDYFGLNEASNPGGFFCGRLWYAEAVGQTAGVPPGHTTSRGRETWKLMYPTAGALPGAWREFEVRVADRTAVATWAASGKRIGPLNTLASDAGFATISSPAMPIAELAAAYNPRLALVVVGGTLTVRKLTVRRSS